GCYCDRRFADLSEDQLVNVVRREAAFSRQAAEDARPIIFIDRRRIVTGFSTHLGAPGLDGIDTRWFERTSCSYAPAKRISAVGLKGGADEALAVASLYDGGTGAITPQEDAGIGWVAEPVNHVDPDDQDALHRCICRD